MNSSARATKKDDYQEENDSEGEFEVEKLLDVNKQRGRGTQYLVRWAGYSS